MKDALGHGSAAHQSGVAELPPFITSRHTGFPVGGYYALDEHGSVLRGNSKYGEMAPRYPTPEKADQVARQAFTGRHSPAVRMQMAARKARNR
jgi:hypothetical protein